MSEPRPPELDGYPLIYPVTVRWGDMDALGHVNNAVYFRYFESARIALFEQVGLLGGRAGAPGYSGRPVGPILARATCDFRRPVKYPARLLCGVRVTQMRRTSVGLAYRLVDGDPGRGEVYAAGDSVVVMFDYGENTKVELSPALRAALLPFCGPSSA